MSYIAPNSTIQFLSDIPFDINYENTIYFDNVSQQETWMANKVQRTLGAQSYTRVSRGVIRVGVGIDDTSMSKLFMCNYMRFKNTDFENKWWYAFVDAVEYVNNNTVEARFHLDVIQTFMFNLNFNDCLIEREHTNTDVLGEHTLPEGLETGPYRAYEAECYLEDPQSPSGLAFMNNRFEYLRTVILASSVDITVAGFPKKYGVLIPSLFGQGGGGEYYSGIRFYSFPITDDLTYINELNRGLDELAGSADADAIVGIFMMPREFIPTNDTEFQQGCQPKRMRVIRKNTVDTYTPRNKKLLCYPYNMLYITNNNGATAEYKVEDFLNPQLQTYDLFSIWGNCSMNPAMYCAPISYNGVPNRPNFDEEITVTGFPMCSYTIDAFKAWLAQNTGVIAATAGTLAASWATLIGGSIAMGSAGLAGTVGSNVPQLPGNVGAPQMSPSMNLTMQQPSAGLIGGTLGALGSLYDHSRKPPQVHGNVNGNLTYQAGQMTFCWYYKQIKAEYAGIIDKFFDMYGYKVNRIGKPLVRPRPKYWYIKTIGCSLKDTIPNDYLKMIEGIFDKGIRFWTTSAVFGDFDPAVNDNTV